MNNATKTNRTASLNLSKSLTVLEKTTTAHGFTATEAYTTKLGNFSIEANKFNRIHLHSQGMTEKSFNKYEHKLFDLGFKRDTVIYFHDLNTVNGWNMPGNPVGFRIEYTR